MVQVLVNQYSVAVKGGLFADLTLSSHAGGGSIRRSIARLLSKQGALPLRELLTTLNGATPAVAALKTRTRVESNAELGGVRAIETVTLLDANTAAGDITIMDDDLYSYGGYDNSPIANLDGNPLGTR